MNIKYQVVQRENKKQYLLCEFDTRQEALDKFFELQRFGKRKLHIMKSVPYNKKFNQLIEIL